MSSFCLVSNLRSIALNENMRLLKSSTDYLFRNTLKYHSRSEAIGLDAHQISRGGNKGVSRNVIIIAVVVVVVLLLGGIYAAMSTTSNTTNTTQSSSTSSVNTSSGFTSTISTSTSSNIATANQNITIELPTNPGGPSLYSAPTDTWPENLLYDPLFYYNLTGSSTTPIPWLATGYTVNPNGQVWTLTLRQGVTFTDGTQFNATSVKDDLDNIVIANVGGSLYTATFDTLLRGASQYIASNHNTANRTIFQQNDGITILSQYSLRLNLTQPESDLLSYFAGVLNAQFSVSPSAILRNGGLTYGVGSSYLVTHSAGEGPYIMKSYDVASGRMIFTANPNWWAISALGLKQPFYQITINVVNNINTEELDIRTGAANLLPLPLTNVFDFANKTMWNSEGKISSTVSGVNVWGPYPSTMFSLLELNRNIVLPNGSLAPIQPFRNHHIVAAINEAWNQSEFIQQAVSGFGITRGGLMLQGQAGYQKFSSYYKYNLTQAKLDIQAGCVQLGCSPKNPLQVSIISTNDQVSELAGSILTSNINSLQAGLTLNFQPLVTSAKISLIIARQFGINVYVAPNSPPDPLFMLTLFGSQHGGQSGRLGFNNATISAMIDQAASTSNLTQRILLYQQIDRAIAQTGNWPPVAQFDALYVTSSNVRVLPYNPVLNNFLPPILAMQPA